MTSMHKVVRVLALAAFVGAGLVGRAEAAPIVTLDPSASNQALGSTFGIDLVVSGLTGDAAGAVGGFSADLTFDDAILSAGGPAPGYTINLAQLPAGFDFSGFAAGGLFQFIFSGDAAADGTALAALQGTGFVLGTVRFAGTGLGVSPLTLSDVILSDAPGNVLGADFKSGVVCVVDDVQNAPACAPSAPEPASFLLLGSGLAIAVRKRFAKARA